MTEQKSPLELAKKLERIEARVNALAMAASFIERLRVRADTHGGILGVGVDGEDDIAAIQLLAGLTLSEIGWAGAELLDVRKRQAEGATA